jgi:hypothetical protein
MSSITRCMAGKQFSLSDELHRTNNCHMIFPNRILGLLPRPFYGNLFKTVFLKQSTWLTKNEDVYKGKIRDWVIRLSDVRK